MLERAADPQTRSLQMDYLLAVQSHVHHLLGCRQCMPEGGLKDFSKMCLKGKEAMAFLEQNDARYVQELSLETSNA